MRTVPLSKHHGLGNDFLVVVATDAVADHERPAFARNACHRNTGIGADGVLFALPAPSDETADVSMRLHNADGSIAEMSGNGIRCFAQAVVDAGLVAPGSVRIATDAGLRVVAGHRSDADGLAHFRVDMGSATFDTPHLPIDVADVLAHLGLPQRAMTIDVGNPHLVINVDRKTWESIDVASAGPLLEAPFLEGPTRGINVEFISLRRSTGESKPILDMKVWERGVGVTAACGTGATASALAADRWGLIEAVCDVEQPGGSAGVVIRGKQATLIGPSQRVADIEYCWS